MLSLPFMIIISYFILILSCPFSNNTSPYFSIATLLPGHDIIAATLTGLLLFLSITYSWESAQYSFFDSSWWQKSSRGHNYSVTLMHQSPVLCVQRIYLSTVTLLMFLEPHFYYKKSHIGSGMLAWATLRVSKYMIILHYQYLFIPYNKQGEGSSPLPIPIQNSMLGINFSLFSTF